MIKNKLEEYKNTIIPIVERNLPTVKIILYGSRARGDFKEGSDIDIALKGKEEIDTFKINKIIWELEDSDLPILFDIVDYAKMSEDMKKNIMKDGIIWKN